LQFGFQTYFFPINGDLCAKKKVVYSFNVGFKHKTLISRPKFTFLVAKGHHLYGKKIEIEIKIAILKIEDQEIQLKKEHLFLWV